jgi:hypothetical protein
MANKNSTLNLELPPLFKASTPSFLWIIIGVLIVLVVVMFCIFRCRREANRSNTSEPRVIVVTSQEDLKKLQIDPQSIVEIKEKREHD